MFIRRLRPILLLSLMMLFIVPLYAQDDINLPADRAVITLENVAQLQPLGRFGTGRLTDAFAWSPDESTLAIGGSTGIWLYTRERDERDNFTLADVPFDFIPTERPVVRLAFSPDGQYLAYLAGGLVLLDYATKAEIEVFEDAQTIAFHPEGAYLMVGLTRSGGMGYVEAALLWDIQSRETLKTFFVSASDWGGRFINFDFSADGTLFAAAWQSGEYSTCGDSTAMVKWWAFDDILNNYTEEELGDDYESGIGHSLYGLYDVKFHPTLNVFGSIHAPSVPSPPPSILILHDPLAGESTSYELGTVVTAYEEDSIVNYYEFIAGFDFNTARSFSDGVDVVIDSSGVIEDAVHTIRLNDSGALQQKLTFGDNITAYAAAPHMTVAMEGRYFVKDSTGNSVRLGASEVSSSSDSNDDGSAFLTRDIDGTWRLWALRDGGEVGEIALPPAYQTWMPSFIPGGRMVKFDTAEDERRFALWDFDAGTTFEIDAANLYENWREVDFSPNGERMAVQRRNGQIEIYNTSSGILLSTLDSEFARRAQLVFSPDATHLTTAYFIATGDLNTSTLEVREWVSDTGELHRDYGSFRNSSRHGENQMGWAAVRYSPDGARLGVESFYQTDDEDPNTENDLILTASVFDVANGETIFTHAEADAGFKSGLFSDDLRRYALDTGDWSEVTVELYDVDRNAQIVGDESNIHDGFYAGGSLMFSPDHNRLIISVGSYNNCGGDSRALYLHDVDTLARVAEIRESAAFMGYGGERETFIADSSMLMITDEFDTGFYDAQTGELITEIDDLDNSRLRFSADSTLLIAARDDGTVTLWGIPTD